MAVKKAEMREFPVHLKETIVSCVCMCVWVYCPFVTSAAATL